MKKKRVVRFDDDGKIAQDTEDQELVEYLNVLESGHVSIRISVESQDFYRYDLVFPLYSTKRSILAAIGLAEKEIKASRGISVITYQAQSRMGWPIPVMIYGNQEIPINDVFGTVHARDAAAIHSSTLEADRAKFRRLVRQLDQLLAGMSPNAASNGGSSNYVRIDLSPHQYEVLRAAVRSVHDFSEVESWDGQVIKVIRSLRLILLESRKLLADVASFAVKPVVTLLDSTSEGLKKMLEEIEHNKSD